LLHKSKDLQVMLYLIRALIPLEGIKGFRDGLSLLEQSLNLFWDGLHPQLDPDDGLDPTLRVNILEELVSQEFIIQPLSLGFLVESKSVGRFSLRDIQYATDKLPTPDHLSKPDINTIKAAFLDANLEELNETHQAITESLKLIEGIESFVANKVGSTNGPNLDGLKLFLKDLRHNVEQLSGSRLSGEGGFAQSDGSQDQTETAGNSTIAPSSGGQSFVSGKISSRHDVIKALDSICNYYTEYEPSSPVPILLERAKSLVTADFMAIVKNMLPDALAQLELLKGPDSNENTDY